MKDWGDPVFCLLFCVLTGVGAGRILAENRKGKAKTSGREKEYR